MGSFNFLSASIYGCGHMSKLRGDYMTALAFYKAALDIALVKMTLAISSIHISDWVQSVGCRRIFLWV